MMEKEIQRKKKVLIDLTNYGSLTAGFGQIAANYAAAFSSMPIEDLHFVYLLRQKYMQEFGPNVTSVPVRRINKFWFLIKFRATYLCSITLFMAILEYFKMHIVWIIYLLFLICRYPFIHRPFNELY